MAMATGPSVVVAVFDDHDEAVRVVDKLRRRGFRDEQIEIARGADALPGLREELLELGSTEDVVRSYERELEAGRTILTIDAGHRADEATAILERYAAEDYTTPWGSDPGARDPRRRTWTEQVLLPEEVAAGGAAGEPLQSPELVVPGRTDDEGRLLVEQRLELVDERGEPIGGLATLPAATRLEEGGQRVELREERLVAHKELREAGEVVVRTEVEEVPSRLEVDAFREEVQVEHVPVGQVVSERSAPWQDGDTFVVPVYEEQLVVVKRLVLKEHLRIRRVGTTERRLFEDTVRRDRLIIEDTSGMGFAHEVFPTRDDRGELFQDDPQGRRAARTAEGGFFHGLVRKALQ